MENKPDLERIGRASTVIQFMGDVVHGIAYGLREDKLLIKIQNAKDAWDKFYEKATDEGPPLNTTALYCTCGVNYRPDYIGVRCKECGKFIPASMRGFL